MFDEQVGICGEHGGEPSSVAFFAEAGLDYVSCSPFRFHLPLDHLFVQSIADDIKVHCISEDLTFLMSRDSSFQGPHCKACRSSSCSIMRRKFGEESHSITH